MSSILKANIKLISSSRNDLRTICVTQVKNLEDELIRSCDIGNIRELTNSRSDRFFEIRSLFLREHFWEKSTRRKMRKQFEFFVFSANIKT